MRGFCETNALLQCVNTSSKCFHFVIINVMFFNVVSTSKGTEHTIVELLTFSAIAQSRHSDVVLNSSFYWKHK